MRTAYTTALVGLADAWRDGAPAGLHLNGHALRLWVVAAGVHSPQGYLLRLGPTADDWPAVGGALSAVGLVAALVVPAPGPGAARGTSSADGTRSAGHARSASYAGPGAAGPAYRVTGRRRLARLAELVGEPPLAAPTGMWPA